MFKNFLWVLFYLVLHQDVSGYSPFGSQEYNLVDEGDSEEPTLKCFKAELKAISPKGRVINLDCPEQSIFSLKILKNTCSCSDFQVTIGGIVIDSDINFGVSNLIVFTKEQLNELGLTKGKSFLSVKISCLKYHYGSDGGDYHEYFGSVSIPLIVVISGMEYEREIKEVKYQPLGETPVFNSIWTKICCNKYVKKEVSINSISLKPDGTSKNWTFTPIGLQVDGKPVSYSLPMKFNFPIVSSQPITLKEPLENESILEGEADRCVGIGYQFYGTIYYVQKYKTACDIVDIPIGSIRVLYSPEYYLYKTIELDATPRFDSSLPCSFLNKFFIVIEHR
jgi:hypothetical protein